MRLVGAVPAILRRIRGERGALLFLFVTLGSGVLISSVSQNQGQAIQLAMMTLLPQILLSGLIFPLSSIAVGVRWSACVLPLTYFNIISRGVMLKAEPLTSLWPSFLFLGLLGAVVVTGAGNVTRPAWPISCVITSRAARAPWLASETTWLVWNFFCA